MYFLSFIGIAIQFFYPQVLIEIFTTAISLLLIILMVLRPEEITDINVGLPSWKAYQYELYKISKTKKYTVRINVINYTNANQVREYLGEEKFYEYIRSIAQSTENLIKREKLDITMFYESPAIFYFLLDGNSVNTDLTKQFNEFSKTVQKDTKENEENGISLTPTLCSFLFPDEINDVDDAIDMGHFFSKMLPEGKNCIMASEITETTQYKLATNMSMILDRAFAKNKFEMYYQPIYDFADKKYHSAEALIRLTDDEYGRIPPSIFIPAAEKNGVILKIGDFVLESVFKFVSENDIQKLGLQYIEINLSVAQCLQLNLLDKIFELQQKYKVSPSNINFEITETTYGDNERIKQNIKKLVQMGYSFSLDDYGTGYSNIQRTVQLPLSLIKIDKSLVDEIVNEQGHSIVKNTIAMMKDIKKSVLAEGVETKEQLDLLREMGCDYIQGFYFSKPLPMDDFVSFLECHNS